MAVLTKGDGEIQITNGDLAALKRIRDAYGLKDETDVVAFAIGVLDKSKGQGVAIRKEDGAAIRLMPSDNIRKDA